MKNTTLAVVIMAVAVFAFLNMAKKRQQNQAPKQVQIPVQQQQPAVQQNEPESNEVVEEDSPEDSPVAETEVEVVEKPADHSQNNSDEKENAPKIPPEKGLFCELEEKENKGEYIAFYFDGKGNYFFWLDATKNRHFKLWRTGTAEGSGLSPDSVGGYSKTKNKIIVDFYNPHEKKRERLNFKMAALSNGSVVDMEDADADTYIKRDLCYKTFGNLGGL